MVSRWVTVSVCSSVRWTFCCSASWCREELHRHPLETAEESKTQVPLTDERKKDEFNFENVTGITRESETTDILWKKKNKMSACAACD